MRYAFALAVLMSAPATAAAQSWISRNVEAKGYLKYMSTLYIQDVDSTLTDNLVHNRLNFRVFLPADLKLGAELRNRIFYGEFVSNTPDFGDQVTTYDGVLPLEVLWVDGNAVAANTIVDRLWLDYSVAEFEARIGRQRVNWGISPVWNPNDVFNAFNYLDFDYEERPGIDGARVQYYLGALSSVQAAYKFADDSAENVGAAMFKFNTSGYDIQLLAGRFQRDWTAGAGWAGSIGEAGFKGEATLFVPSSSAADSEDVALSATVAFEYAFRNGWTGTLSYLLNSEGATSSTDAASFLLFEPTAKNLMPNRHTVFASMGRQLSPLSYINIAGFYAFEVNWIILFPSFTYSVATNWDLDLVGQLFWGDDLQGQFGNQGNALFFRIKWSF